MSEAQRAVLHVLAELMYCVGGTASCTACISRAYVLCVVDVQFMTHSDQDKTHQVSSVLFTLTL